MKRTGEEEKTAVRSLTEKGEEPMLQPSPWQLQGEYSPPGSSFGGQAWGCRFNPVRSALATETCREGI